MKSGFDRIKDRIIKSIFSGCMVIAAAAVMAGCGAASVELSDEDVKRVANYSSDVVSQHNDRSDSRLVDINIVKRKYQDQLDLEIKRQNFRALEQAAAFEDTTGGDSGSGDGSGEAQEDQPAEPELTLAEAIGVPEFDIYYTDYEISRSYPASGSVSMEDVYMGMTAAEGDTLLIMHFNISNTEGLDRECDIIDMKPSFRVNINGANHTVQQTILPDDLSKYEGMIPAYSSAEVVLISEISESTAADIETLSLVVRSAENRPEYTLE